MSDTITITDNRTGKSVTVAVTDGTFPSSALRELLGQPNSAIALVVDDPLRMDAERVQALAQRAVARGRPHDHAHERQHALTGERVAGVVEAGRENRDHDRRRHEEQDDPPLLRPRACNVEHRT